jgi:hypothetical protein
MRGGETMRIPSYRLKDSIASLSFSEIVWGVAGLVASIRLPSLDKALDLSMSSSSSSSSSSTIGPVILTKEHHSQTYTGSDFLCHALVSAGVTHVFGGHGGAIVGLIDAIVRHPRLVWVYCRCETNASQAAAAYAKLMDNSDVVLPRLVQVRLTYSRV